MTIEHDTYETVEGVTAVIPHTDKIERWEKDGVRYYPQDGWREKKAEVWEEVTEQYVNLPSTWDRDVLPIMEIDRLRCVERYDLPEDWGKGPELRNVEFYKKPCLIIERRKG